MELLDENGFRTDGRRALELRRIQCEVGCTKNCEGSALFQQGLTKVVAVVHGPKEVNQNKSKALMDRAVLKCSISFVPFNNSERQGTRSRFDRKVQEWTNLLKRCFERVIILSLYPCSIIHICCNVLQSDGSELSACINATTMALINASVSVVDYVTCCTCGFYRGGTVLDLNNHEESIHSLAVFVIALTNEMKQVALIESYSKIHFDYIEQVFELAKEGCLQVYDVLAPITHADVLSIANSAFRNE
uniref:Putative exosome complex component RRP41 n=1 Tax=Trichuris muris TaxID=70415 RepID=A0A5S6QLI4_TRIMR